MNVIGRAREQTGASGSTQPEGASSAELAFQLRSGDHPVAEIVPNTQPQNLPCVFKDLQHRVISLLELSTAQLCFTDTPITLKLLGADLRVRSGPESDLRDG